MQTDPLYLLTWKRRGAWERILSKDFKWPIHKTFQIFRQSRYDLDREKFELLKLDTQLLYASMIGLKLFVSSNLVGIVF